MMRGWLIVLLIFPSLAHATRRFCAIDLAIVASESETRHAKLVGVYRVLIENDAQRPLSDNERAALIKDPFDLGTEGEGGRAELRVALTYLKLVTKNEDPAFIDDLRAVLIASAKAAETSEKTQKKNREETAHPKIDAAEPELSRFAPEKSHERSSMPFAGGRWIWADEWISSGNGPSAEWPRHVGQCLYLHPEGKRALSLPQDKDARAVWIDLATGARTEAVELKDRVGQFPLSSEVLFSPNGEWLLLKASTPWVNGEWEVYPLKGQPVRMGKIPMSGNKAAFEWDAVWLSEGRDDDIDFVGRYHLVESHHMPQLSEGFYKIAGLALSPMKDRLYVEAQTEDVSYPRLIHVLDTLTLQTRATHKVPGKPDMLRFTPDGKYLITVEARGFNFRTTLYALPDLKVLGKGTFERAVRGLSISADGKKVAFDGIDFDRETERGWVEIFDIEQWKTKRLLTSPSGTK